MTAVYHHYIIPSQLHDIILKYLHHRYFFYLFYFFKRVPTSI